MTQVVPGTAYRVATAGFWSVLCQKRFKFSCLAPELTSSLYIFSIYLKMVLYIMAPDPKKHSAKKGKARTYLCSACKTRHCSPTGAKCPKFNKRRADDEQTDQQTPGKRRRTVTSTVHSTPSGEASHLSDGDDLMSQLLARLNGPPFPESEGSLASRPVMRASQPISQASTTQLPGPSTASSGAHPLQDLPSRDMFTMLCDQVATLADTQARERERMERDTKNSLELMRQSMQQMSQQFMAASQPTVGPPNSHTVQGQAAWPQCNIPVSQQAEPSAPQPSQSVVSSSQLGSTSGTSQVVRDKTLVRSTHRAKLSHPKTWRCQPIRSALCDDIDPLAITPPLYSKNLLSLRRAQGSGGEAPALAKVATHR